jgi:thiosulfate/3-mercaptopyruvate sulfurtransferase
VLDARAGERYRGDIEPVDPRAGHIPIAKSLPWTELLAKDGTLLEPAQITSRFSALGVDDAEQLVASCGSGVTACMLLVAAEYAGLGSGRLFVPSFSGWSEDSKRAVSVGA